VGDEFSRTERCLPVCRKRGDEASKAGGTPKRSPALFGRVGFGCVVRCQRFRAAATSGFAGPRRRSGGTPPWTREWGEEGGSPGWVVVIRRRRRERGPTGSRRPARRGGAETARLCEAASICGESGLSRRAGARWAKITGKSSDDAEGQHYNWFYLVRGRGAGLPVPARARKVAKDRAGGTELCGIMAAFLRCERACVYGMFGFVVGGRASLGGCGGNNLDFCCVL
jgi:hypothetical protein